MRSLQEEMRLRQEAVRAAEEGLTERAASAERACREAENRRRLVEANAAEAEERAHRAEGEVRMPRVGWRGRGRGDEAGGGMLLECGLTSCLVYLICPRFALGHERNKEISKLVWTH